jgi:hypothetical protein
MATPIKSLTQPKSSTDSKIRYSSTASVESYSSIRQAPVADFKQFIKDGKRNPFLEENHKKEIDYEAINRNTRNGYEPNWFDRFDDKVKRDIRLVTVILFIFAIIISLICAVYDLTVRTVVNEDCWKRFKQIGCSFESKNAECIKLVNCISEDNFEIKMATVLIVASLTLLAIKFRRQINKFGKYLLV